MFESGMVIESGMVAESGAGAGAGDAGICVFGSSPTSVSSPPHAANATIDATASILKERFMSYLRRGPECGERRFRRPPLQKGSRRSTRSARGDELCNIKNAGSLPLSQENRNATLAALSPMMTGACLML
jgi:hypothetical protein